MHGWCRWINYIYPVGYGFEAVMVNKFRNRRYQCSLPVPSTQGYDQVPMDHKTCSITAYSAPPGAEWTEGGSGHYYGKRDGCTR